jgi:hypothetical protein
MHTVRRKQDVGNPTLAEACRIVLLGPRVAGAGYFGVPRETSMMRRVRR